MKNLKRAGIRNACAVVVGVGAVCLPHTVRAQELTFTEAQAASGRAVYQKQCASCHGAELEGQHLAPGLTGERFDRTWRGKPASALMFHLRRMPPNSAAAGGLGDETYASILAYLLQANGQAAADGSLPSEASALAGLTIPRLDGAAADPVAAPLVVSAAGAARLAGLTTITDGMLRNPSDADWLQWGRTYDGQNFSPLKTITRANVQSLKPAWRVPLTGGLSMPTPLVHDGVMFLQTIPDTVLALDATTGEILWRHQYTPTGPSSQKMGLALHGGRVFVPTSDLHVLALDARTGELVWNHEIAGASPTPGRGRYQIRSAPLVVGNKVIQGVTASFSPGGGFIVGLDIESGEEVWRFHTIARPDEPGGNSWNGLPLDKRSGGSVWHQGSYDPELNLVYFGVAPTYDTLPLLQPSGDPDVTMEALFTNCTIALNPDTGKLVWYYQHVQNDQWDLDWVFERQIVELTVDGRQRKVVMNAGKMAILDALDAATGEYLFSVDSGTQNVITSIDPKTGAKRIDLEKWPDPKRPAVICPAVSGARSWPPTSYSRQSALLYLPLTEWCHLFGPDGFKLLTSGVGLLPAPHPDSADGMMGRLQAMDVAGRKLSWVHHQQAPFSTSVLATAGGLVFAGDLDPSLKAFDDSTGKQLWQAALDDLPSSSVITYSVGATQYVAVVVGLRNNHINDLAGTYNAFRKNKGDTSGPPLRSGAAIWVFAP
jgi:alcohol dehydrogenase (cytochrome c)